MRLRSRRVPILVCLAGLSPSLWGCPGTLADPEEFVDAGGASLGSEAGSDAGSETGSDAEGGPTACAPASIASVPAVIFQQTCGMTGCHMPPAPPEGLDFASSGVAARLINVASMEVPTTDLISSADPQSSYILIKLTEAMPPVGSQMPLGLPPLSAAQVACVAAWIDSVVADAGSVGALDGGASDSGQLTTDSGAMDSGQVATDGSVADSSQNAPDGTQGAPDTGQGAPDTGVADSSRGGVDSGTTTPTFTEVYTTIFAAHGCTTHHSGAATGGLDMATQATAYANLVGVPATTSAGEKPACTGDRVVAGSAMTSLLYEKVSEAKPPCGSEMPPEEPALSIAEQTTIENWINGGAKNN
jgi:hypothetical protein